MLRIILFLALCLARPLAAATQGVSVNDSFFSSNDVTINVGDTVLWTWTGSLPHSIVSDSVTEAYSSATMSGAGSTFSHTFNTPGDFHYHCGVHGAPMGGDIHVLAPTTPSITRSPTPTATLTATPNPTLDPSPSATPLPYAFTAEVFDTIGSLRRTLYSGRSDAAPSGLTLSSASFIALAESVTLTTGLQLSPPQALVWDGRDDAVQAVEPGTYYLKLSGQDGFGTTTIFLGDVQVLGPATPTITLTRTLSPTPTVTATPSLTATPTATHSATVTVTPTFNPTQLAQVAEAKGIEGLLVPQPVHRGKTLCVYDPFNGSSLKGGLRLMDLSGHLVLSVAVDGPACVPTQGLAPGLYFALIDVGQGPRLQKVAVLP